MIYDPAKGDLDSGIAAGTPFESIPDAWICPICQTRKANFIPYCPPALLAA
jgi:rubredoxin